MNEDLIKIFRASSTMEADIIIAMLNNNGIRSYAQGYNHRSLLGSLGPYIEIDIMVSKSDAKDAAELLKSYDQPKAEHSQKVRNKKTFQQSRPKNWMVAFVLAFIFPGAANLYVGNTNVGQWIVMGTVVCLITFFAFSQVFGLYTLITLAALIVTDALFSILFLNRHRSKETCQTTIRYIKDKQSS